MRLLSKLVAAGMAVPALALCATAGSGNQIPSGPHYNLEIIAKKQCSQSDLTGSNRHVIFVKADVQDALVKTGITRDLLDKTNKIFLSEGDFQVLDGNACDGAKFQLPANPYTCATDDPACPNPTFMAYEVYLRPQGKPGTRMDMVTCAMMEGLDGVLGTADDVIYCSNEQVVSVRTSGKQRFTNVTAQLTTVVVDLDGDGTAERIPLFDARMIDYFWSVDAYGQAKVQLRFVPKS